MSGIKQPVTQVRLTNVAVVRLKVHGRRYEVACYKNKVLSWREGAERDVDEVLQSRHVFTNVSKGVMASDEHLLTDFGTKEVAVIAKAILDRGEVQVSERERAHALESMAKDICALVADLCVNPETRRPYPVRMVEQGMRECHFSMQAHKSAKSQALALIKQLQTQRTMPIERAAMRILITCEQSEGKALKKQLQPLLAAVEEEQWGSVEYRLTALLSPGHYRQVEDIIAAHKQGRAHMDIIDLKTAATATSAQHPSEGEEDDEEEEETADELGTASVDPSHSAAAPATTIARSSPAVASALPSLPPLPPALSSRPSAAASSSSSSVARPAAKSKKALRRELAEEDIRTVGERRDWDEEEAEDNAISDSAQVRQMQQRQAAKAKKERKKHPHQHATQRAGEEEEKAGKERLGRVEGSEERLQEEEEEEEGKVVQETEGKGGAEAEAKSAGRSQQRGSGRGGADSDEGEGASWEGTTKKAHQKPHRRRRKLQTQQPTEQTQSAQRSGSGAEADADDSSH